MRILVLNGPNLNLLGLREPEIYGSRTYAELELFIAGTAAAHGAEVAVRQSNHEGELVDWIQQARGGFDVIIINAAAYTHTSVAILDALKAVALPVIEVHMSDIDSREEFRRASYISLVAERRFTGKGFDSYREAIEYAALRV